MTSVRALLLDIDDTLVDTRAAFTSAIDEMARRWLPHLDAEGRSRAVAHWVADRQGLFRAYTRGELTMAQQRRLRVADLHAAFGGAEPDDEGWRAWEEAYLEAFSRAWRLRPGVGELLDDLDADGIPYGAVTNASRALSEEKFQRLGLAGRVRVLSAVDDRGVGKPDPRMFWAACEALGVEPAEALYVGDELDVDACAASAAGLTGVWLDALADPVDAQRRWSAAVAAAAGTGRLVRVSDLGAVAALVRNGFGDGVRRTV